MTQLRYQAQAGYQVLGAEAKAQVPQLILLLTNANVAQMRQDNPDNNTRNQAAYDIGRFGSAATSTASQVDFIIDLPIGQDRSLLDRNHEKN